MHALPISLTSLLEGHESLNNGARHLSDSNLLSLLTGGVTDYPCPYKCVSERFHMPMCYTALEELIYTFGGPWLFGLILLTALVLLALVLSVARMKYVGGDDLPATLPAQRGSPLDHSFPFLESLNEVCPYSAFALRT